MPQRARNRNRTWSVAPLVAVLCLAATVEARRDNPPVPEKLRSTKQGFIPLRFQSRKSTLAERTPLWSVEKAHLRLPSPKGGIPGRADVEKYTRLTFNRLSRSDFETLRSHYGTKNLRFSPSRAYQLEDFLPRPMAAVNRHRFVYGTAKDVVTPDETQALPPFSKDMPFSFDCWGTALELARFRAHPMTKKFWTYQLDPQSALSVFRKHFDVVSEIPFKRSGLGAAPKEVKDRLSSLQSGDVLLFVAPSDQLGYELLHATTYLGAPTLSNGRKPLAGDLFFEKVGTDRSMPFRVASWEDVTGPVRFASQDGADRFREVRVLAIRQRRDLPLPLSPKGYLSELERGDKQQIRRELRPMATSYISFTPLGQKPMLGFSGFQALDAAKVGSGFLYRKAPRPGTIPLPRGGKRLGFSADDPKGKNWEIIDL